MSRRTFSQTEAWNLFHKCRRLDEQEEQRRNYWAYEWATGVHIGQVQLSAESALFSAISTARKLQHAVVVIPKNSGLIDFIAMPLAKANQP